MLAHEHGVDLRSVKWFQAGVNEAGRAEKTALKLPEGLSCTPVPQSSLSDMLLAGELDAVLSARPPRAFVEKPSRVTRLFVDSHAAEAAYFQKTGIFPIMHVLAIRREKYEQHRWLAKNLFDAFETAKNRSLERALDVTASHFVLPWVSDRAREAQAMLGNDFWPYGLAPNRITLDAFCQYAYEQGVAHRLMRAEELFAPETLSSATV